MKLSIRYIGSGVPSRWHQLDKEPANDDDNYGTLCGRWYPRDINSTQLCIDDAPPGEHCIICKNEAERDGERINHPRHYNMGGPIGPDGSAQYEVIKIIEDRGWGFAFCMGNALKYGLRAPHKGSELEDLRKARWYLERARLQSVPLITPSGLRKLSIAHATEAWELRDSAIVGAVQATANGEPIVALEQLAKCRLLR